MATRPAADPSDSGVLLDGERRVLEMIAMGAALEDVLDTLCGVIDEESGLRSSVFLLDSSREHLRLAAGPHLPDVWRRAVASFPVTATACGAAVTRREQIISPDITADPLYAGFEDVARAAAIGAVWSTPFYDAGSTLGTFAVYSRTVGPPTAANLALVDRATHLASIAVSRHRVERALRESEERFRQIAENIREVFWVWDTASDRITYCSPMYEHVFDRTLYELYADSHAFLQAIHPEDRTRVEHALMRQRVGQQTDDEYRVVRSDGSVRWIRDRSFPVPEANGRVQRVVGIAEDQTDAHLRLKERQLAEDALRESEALFATAFQSCPITVTINAVADGKFVDVNEAFVRMFEYDREAAIGRTALSLGLYADPARRGFIMDMLRHGPVRDVEVQARTRSGRLLDLLISMEHVTVRSEACALVTAVDITDRKRAEAQVRSSEARWRSVFENSAIGIALTDKAGRYVATNRAFDALVGYTADELRKMTFADIAYEDDLAPGDDYREKLLSEQSREVQLETRYRRKNGQLIWVRVTASLMPATEHESRYIIILVEDVTARRLAEHDLEASLRELRTLAGKLMHAQDDERRRIAQMLHETTAQDLAALKMHLARLARTGRHLRGADRTTLAESTTLAEQSIRQIRTLSYLLHPPFLDDAGLLSALRWFAAGFSERSGIEVELHLPQEFDRLPLDTETTLFRIVQESLINIHRHSGSKRASIRLERQPNTLVLAIEDQGRGIPALSLGQMMQGGGPTGVGIAGMHQRMSNSAAV